MLTDLYLTGHLWDRQDGPYRSGKAGPTDPVLSAAFEQIGLYDNWSWAASIAHDARRAPPVVRDQLHGVVMRAATPDARDSFRAHRTRE